MATLAPVRGIPDQPHDHNSPKREFGQTSKFTDLFKVPGLANGNGCTMYDTTSDLAIYHLCMMDAKSDKLSSFSGFSKMERCYQMFYKHEASLKHCIFIYRFNQHNIFYQSICIYIMYIYNIHII